MLRFIQCIASLMTVNLFIANLAFSQQNQSPTLLMGVDQSPPYSFEDANGVAQGHLVRLIEQLSLETELAIEFVFCPWARCMSLVKTGQIDLLPGLAKTAQRESDFIFLNPAIFKQSSSFAFYTRNNTIQIDAYEDLQGLVIGKLRGSHHFETFDQDRDLITVDVPDIKTLFNLLENGRIDTFIHLSQSIQHYSNEYPMPFTLNTAAFKVDVEASGYIVMPKGKHTKAIENRLNQGLLTLQKQGAFDILIR